MPSEQLDVTYASWASDTLKLDVYRPDGASRRCAILFLHGGGWRAGSRDAMRPDARAMAELGYVGLPIQYRLLSQASYPANLHDIKSAIRWTRTQAKTLNIDPDRIILWGSSAGAHLALLASGTPNDPMFDAETADREVSTSVAACIAVHPPTSFYVGARDPAHASPATALLGDVATVKAARAVSPLTHVTAKFPPTLILHGTRDRIVHHSSSQRLHDALRTVKAIVDLHLFHGHDHGFAAVPSMRRLIAAEADYFLRRAVLEPATFAAEIQRFSPFANRVPERAA